MCSWASCGEVLPSCWTCRPASDCPNPAEQQDQEERASPSQNTRTHEQNRTELLCSSALKKPGLLILAYLAS